MSLDWKWLFIYPDQKVATVNTLTVPVGAPLQFQLTSASVMNAFFIPQFGSMTCTMNGMATRLNLRANDPGTFQGLSTQFSGDGFSDMHFDVHCVMAAASPSTAASLRMSRRWSRSPSLMTDMFRFHASIWPSIAAWP